MDELDMNETLSDGSPRYRLLDSGVTYDNKIHRIVKGNSDPEQMRAMALRKVQQKRETMIAAANEAVERGDFKAKYGDQSYIAEIAYNLQILATTLDAPKAVEAAKFLIKETGVSEPKNTDEETPNIAPIIDVLLKLFARVDRNDVIDGEVLND